MFFFKNVNQKSFHVPNKDSVCIAKSQPQDVGQHHVFFFNFSVFFMYTDVFKSCDL